MFKSPLSTLIKTFEDMGQGDNKLALADILSVLAMTFSKQGSRESLKYKLMGNSTDLGSWGHEYVRAIAGEIGQESQAQTEKDALIEQLRENLEELSRKNQFEIRNNESNYQQEMLRKVPLTIYTG